MEQKAINMQPALKDISDLPMLQVLALCPWFLSDLNQRVSFTRQQQ